VNHGTEVNTADKKGNTPFHEVTYKGHVEVAESWC